MEYCQSQVQITCWSIQGLFLVLYSFSSSNSIQKQPLSNRCFLKLCKIHVKASLLESLFNNIPGLKVWNFNKKRLRHRTLAFLWIFHIFSKNLIYRTPPYNGFCWFLHSNQSVIHWSYCFCFFLHFFFLLLLITAIMGVYSESV